VVDQDRLGGSEGLYFILANYLVGLTPEEYHIRKGNIWLDVDCHRWAIWNYDRALRASEDSVVRATLGWCYSQLGMPEAALAHYRRACERNRRADLLLGLVAAEHHAGNVAECGAVLEQLRAREFELSPNELSELARVERMVSEAVSGK
jgi:lipopolysaccharide biosynthesis regulator YciM